MMKRILMIAIMGMLSACISGTKPPETYTDRSGQTVVIESDVEMCKRACNDDYTRCMQSTAASTNNGLEGAPSGIFGASGDCRGALAKCLPTCKSK